MTSVHKLRAEVHQRMVNMRAMDRLVRSPKFTTAYDLDPMNTRIIFAVKSGDTVAVEAWIKETLAAELELGEYTVHQLRAKAAALGIPYPALMTKDQLLIKVAHVQRGSEEAERVPHNCGDAVAGHDSESVTGVPAPAVA